MFEFDTQNSTERSRINLQTDSADVFPRRCTIRMKLSGKRGSRLSDARSSLGLLYETPIHHDMGEMSAIGSQELDVLKRVSVHYQ